MKSPCLISAAALLLGACGESHDCPPSAAPDVKVVADEGVALDALVRNSLEGEFWGTVLVEKAGEVLLHAGYGYAGVQDSCAPTTVDTAYWVGSLSKQITATAVVGLADDGALAIEDSIVEILADVPEDKSGITLRHLLTHTSGLPNNYVADGKSDRSAAVAAVLSQPLDAAPGEQYAYSNDGYALLAAIVEIASEQTFENHLQNELFAKLDADPIGLNGDGGEWGRLDIAERALGASSEGSPQDWDESWGYKGATGALMTVDTLRAWFHALRSGQVIAQDAADTLFEPQAPTGREGLAYGFGWFVASDDDGGKLVLHSGDDDFVGHSSSLRWHESDELLVIVMSNSGYVDDRAAASLVARELAAADSQFPRGASDAGAMDTGISFAPVIAGGEIVGVRAAVSADGPLAGVRLSMSDVITSVDGAQIRNATDIRELGDLLASGAAVELMVERGGVARHVSVPSRVTE